MGKLMKQINNVTRSSFAYMLAFTYTRKKVLQDGISGYFELSFDNIMAKGFADENNFLHGECAFEFDDHEHRIFVIHDVPMPPKDLDVDQRLLFCLEYPGFRFLDS